MRELIDIQAWQAFKRREINDATVSTYAKLPAGTTEGEITDTYLRLIGVEEQLFPMGDYLNGTARRPDDIRELLGNRAVLLTAEHASIQKRNGEDKEADMGTGSLAVALSQDTNSSALIASGWQTSDANYEPDHIFKDRMAEIIERTNTGAHLALHMLDRGRAYDIDDRHGYSIVLGVGNEPSDATMTAKDIIVEQGSDLGLIVVVNKPHLTFKKGQKILNRKEDGSLKRITFAAGPNTTRTFSQNLAKKIGRDAAFAALQIEVNEVLLVRQNETPKNKVEFPSDSDRKTATYLGYMLLKLSLEKIITDLGIETSQS